MKRVYILFGLFLLIFGQIFGQKVEGYVYDAANNDPLTGVSIYYKDKSGTKGTVSDIDGHYELPVPAGSVILMFSYLGYENQSYPLILTRGQSYTLNAQMKVQTNLMDEVVVSVSRYEQKLSDVTVSMELLKASDIVKQDPVDLTSVLKNLPGVEITDRQPSIRGGSGWTYGVGSRCLILVDGMSVLSPGSGEINWNIVPMENVEQVEVLKGASSVLYGSSALNGLINVRTKRPSLDPVTHANVYMGIYGNPENKSNIWWDRDLWKNGGYGTKPLLRNILPGSNPMYNGLDLSHSRRIGNFDLSAGLNLFSDEGYRKGNYTKRFRAGGNLTYHDPRVKGLNYGVNGNFLSNDYAGFFLWRSPEEVYTQSPLANMGREGHSFYVDPFINYSNPDNNTVHRIKGRIYRRKDQIVSGTTGKSISEIANNMGFDSNSIPEIVNIAKNPMETLMPIAIPHLGDVLNGNFTGLAGEVEKLGNHFFPTAKPADYMDLVSWVMGRTPLPTNEEELLPWLENALEPVEKKKSGADLTASYYLDYQFSKKYNNSLLTTGATYERVYADSKVTGTHKSDNIALFVQYDRKFFDKLNLSLGMRMEYYRVDDHYREAETKIFEADIPFKPVFRGGLNYELGEYSFIRASFGQGYRYPSIVEKFVLKDIGGVGAFPNANLKAEQGFNAEIGFKQGYKLGGLKGFVDVAGFYTQYKDMIEFQIGLFDKESFEYLDNLKDIISLLINGKVPGIGAQFTNVGKARISGIDASVNGMYNFNSHTKLTFNLGYVYTQPIDLEADDINAKEEANTDVFSMKSKSNTSRYLKYRQKHSLKGMFDLEWKRINIGTNLAWKSKTLAVDYFMVDEREKVYPDLMDYVRGLMFGDLHDYWMDNNKGYFTMDFRLGVKITKNIQFQGIINNLWNKEYSVRPMDVGAPRTFIMQLNTTF